MINRMAHAVRRWHRGFTLLLGLQIVLWCVGGLVMTAIPITYIHGDHLLAHHDVATATLNPADFPAVPSFAASDLRSIEPMYVLGRSVYRIESVSETYLLDAKTARRIPPLNRAQIETIASTLFQGNAPIFSSEWLTSAPAEARRPVPLWRVKFDDRLHSTFYLSPIDGRLLARRSDLWRVFDFFWMLHIMDYADRSDVNNNLLRISAALAFGVVLTGAFLLFNHYQRRRRT